MRKFDAAPDPFEAVTAAVDAFYLAQQPLEVLKLGDPIIGPDAGHFGASNT
jgi:hypothetical protein